MPRQTRHDWLLSRRRIVSRGAKALRSAGRYDRRLRLEPLEDRRLLAIIVNTTADEQFQLATPGPYGVAKWRELVSAGNHAA